MAFCPKCGVELDAVVRVCPLCATTVPVVEGDITKTTAPWPEQDPNAKTYPTKQETRNQVLAVLAGLVILAIIVVLAVDFYSSGEIGGGKITWSLTPALVLLATLAYLIFGFRLYHAFFPLTLSYLAITAGMLAGLDALDLYQPWFLTLGLPILVDLLATLIISYALILNVKTKGYNILGIINAAITLFLLVLDGLILLYLKSAFLVSWSILTSLVFIPLSFFFFYLHYVLRKKINLGRTFHF